MHDAQLVQVLNRVNQLPQDASSFTFIEPLAANDMLEQLATLRVLHDQVDLHFRLDNLNLGILEGTSNS
jgi:hypothetical protein